MKDRPSPSALDYGAVGILAGSGMAYEILLLRVFSYSQWHHFASLAVALALLGFGAAGTVLALMGKRAVRMGDTFFMIGLSTGALGMLMSALLPYFIRVRPLFAVWDSSELGKLLLVDFISFIPFFGIALCLGQVLVRWPESTKRLYAANLLGSGAGALAASLLLATLFLEQALLLVPVVVLLTGTVFAIRRLRMRMAGAAGAVMAVLLSGWILVGVPKIPVSDFKRLAYLLDLPDAEILERRPGLATEITVVRSDSIRLAPGLSLRWARPVPPQDAIVLGSDTILPLPLQTSGGQDTAYRVAMLGWLPFHLKESGQAAILGGSEGWPPYGHWDGRITWILPDGNLARIYGERGLPDFVEIKQGQGNAFLASTREDWSVIYFKGASAGGDAASEDYLMTRQSLEAALARLEPGGLLALSLPLNHPPRYAPKALRMINAALLRSGSADPWQQVAFLRSMQEGLFLVSNSPLEPGVISRIRAFADQWGFDLAALPDLEREETNRYNLLPEPIHYLTARAVLADDGEIPGDAQWYSIAVPTLNRPYFWQSMQWHKVPALLQEFGRQGLIWLDWSLLATVVKILVAGVLAILLILLPLGRLPRGTGSITRPRICLYFVALGLGFLFLEMAAFQGSLLFLPEPVLAASVVFSVFLIGAGLGSLATPGQQSSAASVILPILLGILLAFAVPFLARGVLLQWPPVLRGLAFAAAIIPLAWSLGRALPWGLRQLAPCPSLIPWAWGINGFASVLAAPLAALLSIHIAQPATWFAGACCYGLAFLSARHWRVHPFPILP